MWSRCLSDLSVCLFLVQLLLQKSFSGNDCVSLLMRIKIGFNGHHTASRLPFGNFECSIFHILQMFTFLPVILSLLAFYYVFTYVQPTTTMPVHMTLLSSVWKSPRLCNTLTQQYSIDLFSPYSSAFRQANTYLQTLCYQTPLCHGLRKKGV